MKGKFIILIGCFLLVIAIGIFTYCKIIRLKTPSELLEQSRHAIRNGNYSEALDAVLKFYDLSFRQDSYTYRGVRSSFAIEIWKEINNQYPLALDKMKAIRDSKENKLRSGDVSDIPFDPVVIAEKNPQKSKEITNTIIAEALFWDIDSLNTALNEDTKTVELFEFLQKKYPKLANACWRAAKKQVMQSARYDLATKQIPDLNTEYQRLKKRYLAAPDAYREVAERSFISSVKDIIKMACATNQFESARSIASDAEKFFQKEEFEKFLSSESTL